MQESSRRTFHLFFFFNLRREIQRFVSTHPFCSASICFFIIITLQTAVGFFQKMIEHTQAEFKSLHNISLWELVCISLCSFLFVVILSIELNPFFSSEFAALPFVIYSPSVTCRCTICRMGSSTGANYSRMPTGANAFTLMVSHSSYGIFVSLLSLTYRCCVTS